MATSDSGNVSKKIKIRNLILFTFSPSFSNSNSLKKKLEKLNEKN